MLFLIIDLPYKYSNQIIMKLSKSILEKDVDKWTKQDIISYLYSINAVRMYGYKSLRTFSYSVQKDLISECWLLICEIPDEKLLDLWHQGEKKLTAWIKRFVENSLSSTGKTRNLQKLLTQETPVDISELYKEKYQDEDNE